ncbi:MAG: acylphosphatase [Gammaproteobacteria bacterium]|nr:acylphosphatase [Gammaproteobacteria bacterium]
MASCSRFLVSGRVQGVFFRASTARQAKALGLTGYAHNLDDGRVEVLACGSAEAIDELGRWLWQGPPASDVDDVSRSEAKDVTPPPVFSTG